MIREGNRVYLEDEYGDLIGEVTLTETAPGIFTIDHTYVDSRYRGRGIASELVQEAVDMVREKGCEVRATCSYAVNWLADRGMQY